MKKIILCSITIGLCLGVMSGCGKSMTDKLEESSKQVEQQVNEKGKIVLNYYPKFVYFKLGK